MTALCEICSHLTLPAQPAIGKLPTATSDCRPFHAGKELAFCPGCGLVARKINPEQRPVFEAIYDDYAVFNHVDGAADQQFFTPDGASAGRTEKIIACLQSNLEQSPRTVLDVGSGSGAGLVAFAKAFPNADIYGVEPHDKPLQRQKTIPDNICAVTKDFPVGKLFDLISLVHVFEHVDDIYAMLGRLKTALSATGTLVLQVPYAALNPFDYVVADHVWHFSPGALYFALKQAGFEQIVVTNQLIEKELTVFAGNIKGFEGLSPLAQSNKKQAQTFAQNIKWLHDYAAFVGNAFAQNNALAVYGSGPAAAWVYALTAGAVSYFIDDDPAKANGRFLGCPVYDAPTAKQKELRVIAPFPPIQLGAILDRNPGIDFVLR